ncbi:MAG: ribonuclease R [Burkholderiales bacterium]|jgi:ribonuclease R|nr:ribonuclease R [Burkholderiales bacterium]
MKKPKKTIASGQTPRRDRDPFRAREAERYEHPVPSRELILEVLVEAGVPMDEKDLARQLDIGKRDGDAFSRRIGAMERDGQIMRNRRGDLCVVEKLDLIRGRVLGHKHGFGFMQREDGGPDLFLGSGEMQKVLHGDRVMARISGLDRRGRPEGKIVEVLEHGQTRFVGRLHVEHGVTFVAAEDKRISQEFVVPAGEAGKARVGQVVTVEIISQPGRQAQPLARVVEILGNYADPGMEIEIALRKHALPWIFSAESEAIAAKLPKTVRSSDHRGRVDLRDMPLVTIDGETARDFDDAVYCEAEGSGFRLVVAIADVSHYVQAGDALDVEARERGNSVYFPRRVIPMLPEAISNGLCSINPEVERLAMVCDMQIDAHGNIKKFKFFPAVMLSHARFTYTEVAAILDDPRGAAAKKRKALVPHLENLYRLYHQLAKSRKKRGAIDFETTETQMIFDDKGKIENIVAVVRNDAHRVIEECMLAANVCASAFLHGHDHPMLYRVHEGPTPEKLEALRDFLKGFGLQLGGGDTPHASDYAKLLAKVKDRPDAQLLQTVMLRSLKQAVYTPKNEGHFGLAYESYTHFTSPIRRYPDLLVHRAIKAVLNGKKYEPGDWQQLGAQCSMTERRADEATRDVTAWLKCYYMRDRVGEVFMGSVAGVAAFGAFVALDDVYVEGLVHISDLGKDYYKYDAGKHQLLGERTGQRYRLGDRVRVKIAKVDLNAARIDFVLAG